MGSSEEGRSLQGSLLAGKLQPNRLTRPLQRIVQSTQAAPEPQFRHGMGSIAHGFEVLAAGQQLLVLLRFFLVCQVAGGAVSSCGLLRIRRSPGRHVTPLLCQVLLFSPSPSMSTRPGGAMWPSAQNHARQMHSPQLLLCIHCPYTWNLGDRRGLAICPGTSKQAAGRQEHNPQTPVEDLTIRSYLRLCI